jgi:hypothetical protein
VAASIDTNAQAVNMEMDLRRELEYWRNVACYLAECHAATAEYDGSLKKTSGTQRSRYASICEKAADAMKPFRMSPAYGFRTNPQLAEERCKAAAAKLRGGSTE